MQPHSHRRHTSKFGFTIVELLVVIVVLGLLAAITIVSFIGIQDKAKFSAMQSELKSINTALGLYKVDNLSYPNTFGQSGCTNNFCGWDQVTGDSFIIGLSPKYISKIPQLPTVNATNDAYLYWSNGTDYQLIRYKGTGLTATESALSNPLLATTNGYSGYAWGYRTDTTQWY